MSLFGKAGKVRPGAGCGTRRRARLPWGRAMIGWAAVLAFAGPAAAQKSFEMPDRHGVGMLVEQRAPAVGVPIPRPRPVPSLPVSLPGGAACEPAATAPGTVLPSLPVAAPHPVEDVRSFIESMGTSDATMEVLVGQGRVLTLREDIAVSGKPAPFIAVADPSVVEYFVVGPRQLRVTGLRIGTTDLSITNADGKVYTLTANVVADLSVLRERLRVMFPECLIKLSQLRENIIVEGQARNAAQVDRIMETVRAFLLSYQAAAVRRGGGGTAAFATPPAGPGRQRNAAAAEAAAAAARGNGPPPPSAVEVTPENVTVNYGASAAAVEPHVINLMRVVGSQQVLLKIRVAELNRTAMREVGADFLVVDPDTGTIIGTQIGGAGVGATANILNTGKNGGLPAALQAQGSGTLGTSTTVFGIFQEGDFAIFLRALRKNLLLKTLAEPNIVVMNGHQGSFLAGGEFPVPVPQVGASGVAPTITVQFREFGVRVGFAPFILEDDVIRLTVDPEVSSVDFSLGTTLVAGGSPVPGLNTRKAHTTVEMRQGQTLMMAGLLQLSLDGQTSRIPGLGDLPIIGPFFSNTTNSRIEKELVILVTPYLVEPLGCDQVPATPGDELNEPKDCELFFMNRMEGRTGVDARSTVNYDDPFHLVHHQKLEKKYISGQCGFSD